MNICAVVCGRHAGVPISGTSAGRMPHAHPAVPSVHQVGLTRVENYKAERWGGKTGGGDARLKRNNSGLAVAPVSFLRSFPSVHAPNLRRNTAIIKFTSCPSLKANNDCPYDLMKTEVGA